MHTIEPFYLWRDFYVAEQDENSITYGKEYSEFHFTNTIYNYVIHPQWDSFGSETLFYKQIWTDYEESTCIIELIGEWNDVINNDIMLLKREVIDDLIQLGISDFVIIMENVLNFHYDIDDYFEEWNEDIEGGVFFINLLPHIIDDWNRQNLYNIVEYDGVLNDINWRVLKPYDVLPHIKLKIEEENQMHL